MTQRQRIYHEPNQPRKVGECGVEVCIKSSRDIVAFPGQLVRTGAHRDCLKNAGINEKKALKIIEARLKASETIESKVVAAPEA